MNKLSLHCQFRTLPQAQGTISLVSGYWSNASKSAMGASIAFIGNDRPEHGTGFLGEKIPRV
jgi:hypothetical protein